MQPYHQPEFQESESLGSFNEILLPSHQSARPFLESTQHSNSSSDTLVGLEEEQSNLLAPPIIHFKQENPFLSDSHTPTPGTSELNQDLHFETSSTEELGLLSLRSSSDPILATTSRQSSSVFQPIAQRTQASSDLSLCPSSILPSFQDTYQIKSSQLESLGLKMDEDCFNVAAQHQSVAAFHNQQSMHHNMHGHGYGFQQQSEAQFMSSNTFYQQYEPCHGVVSLLY